MAPDKRMRLLVLVEYFPPVLGRDLRIFELTRRLPPAWDVRFLVTPSLRELFERTWHARGPPPTPGPIAVERLRVSPIVERLWKRVWSAAVLATFVVAIIGCVRAAKRIRPNLVIANYPSPYTGFIAYSISRFHSIPFLVDFCDDIAAYTASVVPRTAGNWLPGLSRRAQDFLIRQSCKLPVATSSLRTYALRRNVPEKRIAILPNGVDLELFSATAAGREDGGVSDDTLRCFYGGSLEPWAGSSLLVEVARKAFEANAPIEFWIAGIPPKPDTDGLPPNVQHLGYLTKKGIADAIRKSDCVLVPLRPGHLADGTSPLKLFEGLAAGKPCICSRVGGISDVIVDGENGLLVDAFDSGAWLTAIERLVDDGALRRRLAENAKITTKQHDWGLLAQTFDGILREAIG